MRLVILDTETTGLSRKGGVANNHRIIEIACIELQNGEITGRQFHTYINPHMKVDAKAKKIHGISDAILRNKPSFADIVDGLIDFIGDSPIVVHNAAFDTSFLDKEFSLLPLNRKPFHTFHIIDTLELARSIFPGQKNDLNSLASRYGIRINREVHGALVDCKILAEVYINLLNETA